TKSWSPPPVEGADTELLQQTSSSSPVEEKIKAVDLTGSTLSLPTDPLNASKLSELDNLLFPRIQDKARSPSVASQQEKSAEVINMERMKNKKTLLSHYFEDGK